MKEDLKGLGLFRDWERKRATFFFFYKTFCEINREEGEEQFQLKNNYALKIKWLQTGYGPFYTGKLE